MVSAMPRSVHPVARWLPIVGWLDRYRRDDLGGDLVAGLTVAAMLVPQGMAYALLAGMPPQAGLYAATVPIALYAVFGTSRQLAVGPVAIMSLLTASALAPLAEEGTARYVELAALLALVVAALHLLLAATRMGWIVNLLSHPVLVGYTAAAALIIGASQLKHLLGVAVPSSERFVDQVGDLVSALDGTSATTVAVGLGAMAAILAVRRWRRTFPAALVAVVGSILAVELLDLEARGVATIGEVPSDLPRLVVPAIETSAIGSLLPAAVVITLAGFMESIAIAKVFARRNRYDVEPGRELVGLGAANAGAGLFGGFPVTGGFSRTAVNADAGARTPLASLVSVAVVLLALVTITPLLASLPSATLAAVVLVAVGGLVDWREARHIAAVKRSDLVPMVVAFGATLALGIELGIAVAVAVSLAMVFARVMRPHTAVLGRIPGTGVFRNVERFPEAEEEPDVAVLRIDVSISFANVAFLKRRITELRAARPEARALVLDLSGVNDLDTSGEQALREILQELDDAGVEVHLATVKGPVRDVLERSGLWAEVHPRVHLDTHAAVRCIHGHEPRVEAAELAPRPADTVGQAFGAVSA